MTTLYSIVCLVVLALWFMTTWTFGQVLAPWSGKAKVILVLAFLCAGLVLLLIAVVDGARRLYLKHLGELDTAYRELEKNYAAKFATQDAKVEKTEREKEAFKLSLVEDHRNEVEAVRQEGERNVQFLRTKLQFSNPIVQREAERVKQELVFCRAEVEQLKAQVEPLKADLRVERDRWAKHIVSKEPKTD